MIRTMLSDGEAHGSGLGRGSMFAYRYQHSPRRDQLGHLLVGGGGGGGGVILLYAIRALYLTVQRFFFEEFALIK